jgi:hypothetical protein
VYIDHKKKCESWQERVNGGKGDNAEGMGDNSRVGLNSFFPGGPWGLVGV